MSCGQDGARRSPSTSRYRAASRDSAPSGSNSVQFFHRRPAPLTPPRANARSARSLHQLMKIRFAVRALTAFALALPLAVHAADPVAPSGWHAQTLPEALAYMLLFAFVGILAAIAGYKLFDKCTPGDLH